MIITIITLFPEIIKPFLNHSILKQAQAKKKVTFALINPRQFTQDKHRTVDDRSYGGGAGMLLMIEPLVKAIEKAEKKNGRAHKILLSPQGEAWNQKLAISLIERYKIQDLRFKKKNKQIHKSKILYQKSHLVLICGHYEGIDARIQHYIDQEISIGDYILSGGEAAALVVIDSLVRLIPGVLSKKEATQLETFMEINKQELYSIVKDRSIIDHPSSTISLTEYPQYTRPKNFRGLKVPSVLLSGDHKKIKEWRLKRSWEKTKKLITNKE